MNNSHIQLITFRSEAYHWIKENVSRFKLILCLIPASQGFLAIIGAGAYFSPLLFDDIDCRCGMLWCDLSQAKYKIFPKECDITPIVEFLRLGGVGYGYSKYNA
ncbi:hypothetical protein [Legionella sp. 227]|uniref:hypothetical protein n=1 Tax=Legionella sp. 227 TaxID=3367288 RepID=UPI00370DDFE8